MSCIGLTRNASIEWHQDGQARLAQPDEDLQVPRRGETGVDLPCSTSASAESIILVDNVDSKSITWGFSLWLSSIIGFLGQQIVNYITGVSEKMEKLEYY
jgi:hypothetical protein